MRHNNYCVLRMKRVLSVWQDQECCDTRAGSVVYRWGCRMFFVVIRETCLCPGVIVCSGAFAGDCPGVLNG